MEDFFYNYGDYLTHKLAWLMVMIGISFVIYIAYPSALYLLIACVIWIAVAYEGYQLFNCVGIKIIDDEMIIDDGKKNYSIPLKHVKTVKNVLPLIKLKSSKIWWHKGINLCFFSIKLLDNKSIYCIAKCKSKLSGGKGREEIELFKSLVQEAKRKPVKDTATAISEK